MVRALEDYAQLCGAERRAKAAGGSTIPLNQVIDEFKITKEVLDAVEVEIECMCGGLNLFRKLGRT